MSEAPSSLKLWLLAAITWSVFLVALFVACSDGPTGPTPPPEPTTTTTTPVEPPFNPGVQFSWSDTRGILVFAGTQATEGEIVALDSRLRGMGWPTPFYHVCSEVARWEQTPWADGPEPFSPENLENLRRFLKTTAELGSQVMLDVFCTVRDAPNWMVNNGEEYSRTVGEIIAPYDHVVVHVANEPWHPSSWFRDNPDKLRRVRDWLRQSGFRGEIGADDNAGRPGDTRYNGTYQSYGFWPDFHPWREDSQGRDRVPSRDDLREFRNRNSWGQVVISEPIAYSEWRGGGCCTDNRNLVTRYMNQAEEERLVWTYHSTDGLEWPTKSFGWIPQ